MTEMPDSIFTGATFCCIFFNAVKPLMPILPIYYYFGYFVKNPTVQTQKFEVD